MQIEQQDDGSYLARLNGKIIGQYPDPTTSMQLYLQDWLAEMSHIAIYGCTSLERLAKQERLKFLAKAKHKITEQELELANFMPKDKRPRYRLS